MTLWVVLFLYYFALYLLVRWLVLRWIGRRNDPRRGFEVKLTGEKPVTEKDEKERD